MCDSVSNNAADICFVAGRLHDMAKAKYCTLSKRLVRLNNYDHVTISLFAKFKILLNDPNLSRFKNPKLKICLACCKHFSDKKKDEYKKTDIPNKPETEDNSLDKLLDAIKTLPLSEVQLNILMLAVGERLAPMASKHVAELNKTNLETRLEKMSSASYQQCWHNAIGPLRN